MLTYVNICLIALYEISYGSIIDDIWYIFYTYSIKSSITGHLTGRLAIAILSWATSSTAFLYTLLIDNLNFS